MDRPFLDPSRIDRALAAVSGVRLAVAFGSTVRGLARRESDVDIGLWLGPELARADRYETIRTLLGVLGRVLPASRLDLVVLNDAGPRLAAEALRHGLVLFEAEIGELARFRREVSAALRDMEPRRRMVNAIRLKRLQQEHPDGRYGDLPAKARRLARLFE